MRAHNISFGLRHRRSALEDHALREQPCGRLAVLNQSQIAHHFAPETRIQQVQNRMRDPANVLVDRKPVFHFRRIEWRIRIVRIAVPVEIP